MLRGRVARVLSLAQSGVDVERVIIFVEERETAEKIQVRGREPYET